MKSQLKILLFINSFFVFAVNLFAPFFAVFVQNIENSTYHIGGIWGFYIFATGVFTLNISKYENHEQYADYFLIAGFIFRALGWLGYIFSTNLWHLYMIQVLLALGQAFSNPSFNLIYSINLSKEKIASEWGINSALTAFVCSIASVAGGIIISNYGFTTLLIIMIGFSMISTFIAIKYRKKLT